MINTIKCQQTYNITLKSHETFINQNTPTFTSLNQNITFKSKFQQKTNIRTEREANGKETKTIREKTIKGRKKKRKLKNRTEEPEP